MRTEMSRDIETMMEELLEEWGCFELVFCPLSSLWTCRGPKKESYVGKTSFAAVELAHESVIGGLSLEFRRFLKTLEEKRHEGP